MSVAARTSTVVLVVLAFAAAGLARAAHATDLSGAIVDAAACAQHQIPPNDDGSTSSSVPIGFTLNFFGRSYDQLWVNNNGNVTFDGPLSTYTPFGIRGSTLPIIAPFFADVDTRSGGNLVTYGFGNTTYQGHAAFCVDWVDVGYYNQRYDKKDSFQLLLVQRPDSGPGDFDIVFNYGSIQWETGEASGGVDGLGGASAYVGYSNGDGSDANSFELLGSGRPGSFLDGNTDFSLIGHAFGPTFQIGRYVFPVRTGAPPPNRYVAVGDSYQSGVGAGDYDPATNQGGVNECLRSANAYAHLLVNNGTVNDILDFVACSGAKIGTLYQSGPVTNGPPWNEDAQIDHLNTRTALVTVGIGGNDLNFGPLIRDCVLKHFIFQSCEDAYDAQVTDALIALLDHGPHGLNTFQTLYADIRMRAWRGKWLVLGYPRMFPVNGGSDWWSSGLFFPRCNNIRVSDQMWVNYKVQQLDLAIRSSAQSMGLTYVDIQDASAGHELCAGDPSFLNGIVFTNTVESFHPTAYGHTQIAARIAAALGGTARRVRRTATASETILVHPGETIDRSFMIDYGTPQATFSTSWPGSTVDMTLVSPSGHRIDNTTTATDVYHASAPTQELYAVSNPEPGTWTVELHGTQVQDAGEPTTLDVFQMPRPNADPFARFKSTLTGRTVSVDASESTDSDGQVVRYLWDFGDGTKGTGVTASHLYTVPGSYRVTLVVADNQEALGFADDTLDIVIPKYVFNGFFPPVDDKALNDQKAGSTVPVKFTIDGATVANIFDAGFPQTQQIDCVSRKILLGSAATATDGAWVIQDPVSGQYHYNWKTSKAFSGTCQRLTIGLDDGTRDSADFSFH
jgi:PKD repeat protein